MRSLRLESELKNIRKRGRYSYLGTRGLSRNSDDRVEGPDPSGYVGTDESAGISRETEGGAGPPLGNECFAGRRKPGKLITAKKILARL